MATQNPVTGEETRQTLSAQGRAFSSPDGKDPLATDGDDNGGNANGNYTPKGSNIDGPVKPENKPKQKQITDFLSEGQATEYQLGTRVGAEGPGSFIEDADSTMASALGAALGGGMGFDMATSPFDPKNRRQIPKATRCTNGSWQRRNCSNADWNSYTRWRSRCRTTRFWTTSVRWWGYSCRKLGSSRC